MEDIQEDIQYRPGQLVRYAPGSGGLLKVRQVIEGVAGQRLKGEGVYGEPVSVLAVICKPANSSDKGYWNYRQRNQ